MNLPDQLTGMSERPQAWWSSAPQPQKFGVIGGAAALVIALVVGVLSMDGSEQEWEPAILYVGLEYEDAAEITTRLAATGIQYKLSEDATTITVPKDQVSNTRLTLAGEGFPKSGRIGYEIFDENQIAMTEFLQTVNLVRALQGELEETLSSIDGVRQARVMLVVPEESLFTEHQNPTTASVVLTLKGGKLRDRQVEAVANLVSSSVEGLHKEHVVIVDQEGNLLSEEYDPLARAATKQFEMQRAVEFALEEKVQSLMDEVIGSGRSKVRINVDLDFSQKNSEERLYAPAGGGGNQILSEETNEKSSAEQGTEENAVRNYEINRTINSIVGTVGSISRLSMALTVDQTKVVIDPDTREIREELRPDSEIQQLADLAQQAIGFDESRGDEKTVFSMPFDKTQEIQSREQAVTDERREFWTGIAINVAKVLGILAALITLRFIIQAIGRGVGVEEDIEVLGEISGDVDEEDFERPDTPHDIILSRVQQMVRERPEDAAKLIRTMLVEDGS
jgi:flagellar M-ring protein FliF